MKRALTVLMALSVLSVFGEKFGFNRYQSVIDRQMFGALPKGFDPAKLPSEVKKSSNRELSQEEEKLKNSINFSVINVDLDGVVHVGFSDMTDPKAPVHYYLKVGETQDGWKVVEADKETASMTIERDDVSLELTLGDNTKAGQALPASATKNLSVPAGPKSESFRSRRDRQRKAEGDQLEEIRKNLAALRESAKSNVEAEKANAEVEKAKAEAEKIKAEAEAAKAEAEKAKAEAEKAKAEAAEKENGDNDEKNDAE